MVIHAICVQGFVGAAHALYRLSHPPTHRRPEIEVRLGDGSGEVKELARKAHLWSSLGRSEAS